MDKQVEHWIKSAEQDLPVAESMFEKCHYSWCLFIGHLVLEKILKAFYTKETGKGPPRIHDLVRLAKSSNLNLNQEKIEFLSQVNDFHLEARYPLYKDEFLKICTKDFTSKYFNRIKEMYHWLKANIL